MNLSIIIPCKNESENIRSCLQKVVESCSKAEILVMDSGCEKTRLIVESFQNGQIHYHQCSPDRGKGDAIQQGIQKATGEILVQFDADLQFFAEDISQLVQSIINNECDMALGSRFKKRHSNPEPFLRTLGNQIVSLFCSVLFSQKITDALAGFKAWKKQVTLDEPLKNYNFSYEIELISNALQNGYVVKDIPVQYALREYGQSKVSVIKVGLQLLRDAIKMRLKWQ